MGTCRFLIIVFLTFVGLTASAQKKLSLNDSIMHTVRVKVLTEKRAELKKRIAVEDGKRNKIINGVTLEVQEEINDKQDSICLDLRSQLVTVELELKELLPEKTVVDIVGQLNLLDHGQPLNEKTLTERKTEE